MLPVDKHKMGYLKIRTYNVKPKHSVELVFFDKIFNKYFM